MAERAIDTGTWEEVTGVKTATVRPGRSVKASLLRLILLGLPIIAAVGTSASDAEAYTNINSWSVAMSSTQAGGHPDVTLHFTFDNRFINNGGAPLVTEETCDCQDVEQIANELPAGFIGNPHALPQCTLLEFGTSRCPAESQVGIASVLYGQQPLYNLEPHPGQPGLLAFSSPLLSSPVFIELYGRTDSDYGLDSVSSGIVHLLPIQGLNIFLWGVPGSPTHNVNRFPSPQPGGYGCFSTYPEPCWPPVGFNGEVKPYLENPTSCGEPLTAGLGILYYDHTFLHADTAWPATTGCDILSFDPSLTGTPTTTQADTVSGLDIRIKVPQAQNPTTPSPSEIHGVDVTLPPGFSINPAAADGKTVCTEEQGSFGTLKAANCPEHSKIGLLTLDSSALPAPIDGAIYLGEPQPGYRYRLYLAADGFSTHVKLAGSVRPDPATGQLVISFPDLPQSPFQDFAMHVFGSERGLLSTPTQCGTYPVQTTFTPWDSLLPDHHSTSFFSVDSGPGGKPCPDGARPFKPTAAAGSPDNTGGAHSPYFVELERSDGDQSLAGLNVATPAGLLASLRGIPYCSDAALAHAASQDYSGAAEVANPSCPQESRLGSAVAGSGAGTRPLHVYGSVYLSGPYKGEPLSLAAVVPAVSGPYDLGSVVIRVALHVDPITAQVTAVSDPLPQIVEGIPLRLRSIRVNLDRSGFMLNPTNCDPTETRLMALGNEGAVSDHALPYQVANCADLPFRPGIALKLGGGVNRRGHPSIHTVISAKPGEANTRSVTVTLPKGELLDNSHFGTVCTRVQFAQDACPAGSVLGQAEVTTPLLDQPLKGTVYLRSSDQELPDLALDLEGQFDIQAIGHIDSVKGRLRARFNTIPDAPLSRVAVDLTGGAKGLVANSESLCERPKAATVRIVAQSGRALTLHPKLQTSCGGKGRAKRHRRSTGGK